VSTFNPQKPYNSLPLLPPIKEYYNLAVYKKVVKATDELSKLNGLLLSTWDNVAAVLNMLSPFYAPEAEASSKVENIVTTTEEILMAGVIEDSKQSPAQKEGKAYADALARGALLVDKNHYLNTNSFLRIQAELVIKGKGIRQHPGTQLINDKTGEVYYTPPDGEALIRDLLKNLEDYLNKNEDDIDPLIKMAVIHYQFEAIHPFYDGNGRTGRIIMPLYLVLAKKTRYPFLFMSGYVLKNKNQYYRQLRKVTNDGDWLGWVDFILDGVIATAKRTSDTLIEIKRHKEIEKPKIAKVIPIKHNEVIQFIYNEPIFTRKQMAAGLGVHGNSATKYAEQLVELRVLRKQKIHKNWIYVNTGLIVILQKFANWD